MITTALGATGCEPSMREAEAKPRAASEPHRVTLAPVEHGEVSRPVRAVGVVAAKQTADLSFKVGGVVSVVGVEEGSVVKKGQVLARVDATEVSAGAAQAKSSLEKAQRDATRLRALHADRTIALAELQNAETALAVAKSTLTAASFNERHTVLVAPDDGVIEQRLAEPGEVVAPGRPIVRFLGKKRGFVVHASLSDRDVVAFDVGAKAEVTIDAVPDRTLPSAISDISRIASARTGSFDIEIPLPSDLPFSPRAGLSAKVKLLRTERPAATVPLAAIVDGDGGRAFVFAEDGGKVKRLPIRVAFLFSDRAAVNEGLEGVTQVVVAGASELSDGADVVVSAAVEAP